MENVWGKSLVFSCPLAFSFFLSCCSFLSYFLFCSLPLSSLPFSPHSRYSRTPVEGYFAAPRTRLFAGSLYRISLIRSYIQVARDLYPVFESAPVAPGSALFEWGLRQENLGYAL